MSEGAANAFGWAYQWWLAQDYHFMANLAGKPGLLNDDWLRAIGRPYGVSRTLRASEGSSAPAGELFRQLIERSGQGNGMALIERAARIYHAVEARNHGLSMLPLSFLSKASWFIWPEGWTMFDSYASTAVLGRSTTGIEGFKQFYVALDVRGWSAALAAVRTAIGTPFDRRMAERVLDAYLVFEGCDTDAQKWRVAQFDSFRLALPGDLRDAIDVQSERIAEVLDDGVLLWRNTSTDRRSITDGIARLNTFKNGLN
jgi:hypothetical protein